MQNTIERTRRKTLIEKKEVKERIKKHRERRYGKSDEKAMNNLLEQAKAILYV